MWLFAVIRHQAELTYRIPQLRFFCLCSSVLEMYEITNYCYFSYFLERDAFVSWSLEER